MTSDLFPSLVGTRIRCKKILRVFSLYQIRHLVKGKRYRYENSSLSRLFGDLNNNWTTLDITTVYKDTYSVEIVRLDLNFFECLGILEIKGKSISALQPSN